MKKLLSLVALSFLIINIGQAQSYKKALKNASKAAKKYAKDMDKNAGELDEALAGLDEVFAVEGASTDVKALLTKAEIYNAIASTQISRKAVLDPDFVLPNPEAAMMAFNSCKELLSVATKKGDIKKALKELSNASGHVSNAAIFAYNARDYAASHQNFVASLEADELIVANGGASKFVDVNAKNEQVFSTAVTGYYGEAEAASMPYFQILYDASYPEPLVYEALYNLTIKEDAAKARTYLDAGRAQFPDDKGLLFAEINQKLSSGDLDAAKLVLAEAVKADPENLSIYITSGSVYERLSAASAESGDAEKAKEYFDAAMDYYNQALAKDGNNFDANYSIGALYYNQAAAMTEEINKFANDFSKAGTQKYEEAKAKMDALFEESLPFFDKAESVNPTDINTLIALKEIYARKNDFAKADEYKAKIDASK